MSPKPEESIPVVHVCDERELGDAGLNNSASLSNLSANLKLNAFINNGFVSDCAQAEKLASDAKDELRKEAKNSNVLAGTNTTAGPNANMAVAEKPIVDFDDLLPHVGEFGRYQKILFLLMIPFAFFVAFVYFSQIFITLVPEEHWCHVPELQHLSVEERKPARVLEVNGPIDDSSNRIILQSGRALAIPVDKSAAGDFAVDGGDGAISYSKCTMYAVNFTEVLANNIRTPDPSWPTQPCRNGWEYNFTDVPYQTAATDFEWVCDHAYLPTLAQSIFFLGAIVGGLLFGWIADRYGRIPALAGCNIVGFAAGVATAFVGNFWQFSLCRFLVGFAFDNCFTMMYILVPFEALLINQVTGATRLCSIVAQLAPPALLLAHVAGKVLAPPKAMLRIKKKILEYVGPKWRTFVANMSIALFFTTASCALPWIAYYLADWKTFAIVTSAPLALAILTPLLVPESARWLVSQGKIDKAIGILKKFEKINKKTIDAKVYQEFSDSCIRLQEEEAANNNYSVLDLFKTPRLRNITILLIIIWMAISLVFDGHVRNVGSLGLDLFFTFTVAAATELPADTFLTLTLDRWGRRWLACGTMVASGLFSLFATMVPMGAYSATLAILGRFSVNISYNIGLQYAAELLPTVVRAQGVAFIHIMGYVASIVAPFVVYLANISPSLPLIVLGILGIFGGLLSLLLPETLGHDLPQTLADGEDFGRGQKIWDFPCLAKKVDDADTCDDLPVERFTRATSKTSIGASLRASTRGELRSSMLNRSIRSRVSVRSLAQCKEEQMSAGV
ncbi:AGAP006609-PA-like protein [Anopheles sinensis]|uniref:AGAP006609-PA-like protein n=1 Tax=Anopheles sinensis TaxID=74873 RepID=A0A084WGJ3_ANOSI|nr:AGAP006609-PA-like protein [Anopheles sinensis]